jgi:hypothetical protein
VLIEYGQQKVPMIRLDSSNIKMNPKKPPKIASAGLTGLLDE